MRKHNSNNESGNDRVKIINLFRHLHELKDEISSISSEDTGPKSAELECQAYFLR